MPGYFNTITEENKLSLNKPADKDVVYYSELNEWFTSNAFRSFSLKYVVDKCIHYKVGNKEHSVTPGNFLLACKQPYVKAYFDSKTIVKSVCIDICPDTVAEAFTIVSANQDYDFDNYRAKYFSYPEFFESVCPAGITQFGKKLDALVKAIKNGSAHKLINREWFLDLIEKIIYHEYGNYLALNGLHSVKLETRKELLSRLSFGKQFMDENFLSINEINQVSVSSNLSEFHFFRSFRQAYGISPYQYLLNKRLEFSRALIAQRNMSLTEISMHCNFPDLFTFSKAFKRRYGVSPSQLPDC
ncbi:MAG TPA: helix-turn-helix transcriptional regulator [Puia sp.]|nr:helix-turn-helix transcriptional regulator [Puia sp.]